MNGARPERGSYGVAIALEEAPPTLPIEKRALFLQCVGAALKLCGRFCDADVHHGRHSRAE
jgi:hypothetical protein